MAIACMALHLHYDTTLSLCFLLLLLFSSPSMAKTSFRPKALILPVTKDSSTRQYTTHINQRTPLVLVKLTVDLGGESLWVDCERGYVSSSYRSVNCRSAHCVLARSVACGDSCFLNAGSRYCNKNACFTFPVNPPNQTSYSGGEAAEDVLSIRSTTGQAVTVPRFVFTCVPAWFLGDLARGVKGMAGLGRSNVALPTQLAQAFSFQRKFAICLSSSAKASGVIVFGDSPYVMLPHNTDISKSLIYTPLVRNPIGTRYIGQRVFSEYYIGVKSIRVNGKAVPLNKTLLSFSDEGDGGTRISTVDPFSILENTIYESVKAAFIRELPAGASVTPVAPFGACFIGIGRFRVGPQVPSIDLVLQSQNVYWRISGENLMVQVTKDIMCLGFVDSATASHTVLPKASIVIGAHQIEDNLLVFDLPRSRVGFSSSLLLHQTTCANFNTTSHV